MGFGGMGLFVVAVLDSSVIPLPIPGSTDLLLLLLVARRANALLMAAAAIAGSIVGGYTCWSAGARGRERAMKRYAPTRYSHRIASWVGAHGGLAVALSALAPPPVPMLPFLVGAGALGVPRRKFLISYTIARIIRYGLIAWLGATYGRRMARLWSRYLANWSTTIDWTLIALLVGAALFGIWKWRKMERQAAGAMGVPSDSAPIAP